MQRGQDGLRRERDAAVEEANQFREDVRFLTHETEKMLLELKEESEGKMHLQRELHRVQQELEGLRSVPAFSAIQQDKIQINTLRSLNEIIDRDKHQQNEQIQLLIREKEELLSNLDNKLREINSLFESKKLLERDNELLLREGQNMRFQIQDKDSIIQRLQFKLEREKTDRARGLSVHMSDTLNQSRVDRSLAGPPDRLARSGAKGAGKENAHPAAQAWPLEKQQTAPAGRLGAQAYGDPYAQAALSPDFLATRSDLLGRTGDQTSPLRVRGSSPGLRNAASDLPSPEPDPDASGLTISQAAAIKVRTGLSDLRTKLSQMKEQKEKAEREMLQELDEYHKRKALEENA